MKEGSIKIDEFCRQFETTYNLELNKSELNVFESRIFEALFNKVVWFSPIPEERRKIPNYLGEDEIHAAVNDAARALNNA